MLKRICTKILFKTFQVRESEFVYLGEMRRKEELNQRGQKIPQKPTPGSREDEGCV